ncbi:MAG: RluA family pseudouridine synthase [Deltaproteobacteria bacterium]|nr:RluA family pseudouridine synthase [Deltaproteobacteria bacterium]
MTETSTTDEDESETEQRPPTRFVVAAADAGVRLDAWLARRVPGLSRRRAIAWLEESKVEVNGRRRAKGALVAEGDVVTLSEPPPPEAFDPIAEDDAALVVLFEDDDVVVVDKPAGVACHPLRHDERGTIANALVARFPEIVGVGYARREPGILHRLDNGTSGVLLVARTKEAFESLREALRAGRIEKRYVALVTGLIERDEGVIDVPLAPHPRDARKVLACAHERDVARYRPRPATTRWKVLERIEDRAMTLVELAAETAARHQIRAHLAAAGHALVGDVLYGGPEVPGIAHQLLHASRIVFPHPRTGRPIDVHVPLPGDFSRAAGRALASG